MSVRTLITKYEAASVTDPDIPPPSPARFLPRRTNSNSPSISAPPSELTTSETLIDDLSRPPDSESDETSLLKHTFSLPASRTAIPSHTPVPATTVFKRNAPPLSLPALDKHLSKLRPPPFHASKTPPAMFPPMQLLAKSGLTLEDLEENYKVPPWYRDKNTLLGAVVSVIMGITGSSAVSLFYSLQGLNNTVQVFALILSTIVPVGSDLGGKWRTLFLGTIPKILALNFMSSLTQALIFLVLFFCVAMVLLYFFLRAAAKSDRYRVAEGLQQTGVTSTRTGLVVITFLITVLYLPLSTLAVHVLVWSSDIWVVPNPYTNATTFPPIVPPLGPSNRFRDPLDFCWTTTMSKDQINYAPVLVILSLFIIGTLTIWFPIALNQIIENSVPKVDPYTELGRLRSTQELDTEYHRLLSRDRNPFAFIYNGFRRNWASYEAVYLFAKLSALVTVTVMDSNNCLFRNLSRTAIPVARQVILLLLMVGFFLAQCILGPFLDPVNNASEWMSRLNYVLTAALALAISLNVHGQNILNTYVLYAIYVITYGFSFYFTVINTFIMQQCVKIVTRRLDFSIDIFSPRLDISSQSIHTRRRIWQEAITTLFLTSPECRIPASQPMRFAQARDSEYPPYLLNFQGTPAERHVENIKILREIGMMNYRKGVALVTGPDFEWFKYLQAEIQQNHVGPDSFWRPPHLPSGVTSPFGNSWWIPFPPTLVIRYDDGPLAVLRDVSELQAYVEQNASSFVSRKREVRMALRALEGLVVSWPYTHVKPIGGHTMLCCCQRYTADNSVHYESAVLRIKRRGHLEYEGLQLGSGFELELNYSKRVKVGRDVIGLNDDYEMTPDLARFFSLNRTLIPSRVGYIDETIHRYRLFHQRQCKAKRHELSYRFLLDVYDHPRELDRLLECSMRERDLRVRQLVAANHAAFETAYTRMQAISESPVRTWWYLLWDDIWRRNYATVRGLTLHASDFDPHYPTSVAYTPLSRPVLEAFLTQRGLLSKSAVFTSGFLNKVYVRLNDIVFRGSKQASPAAILHLGDRASELDMEELDQDTAGPSSTLDTGVGTDHDDSEIRPRPEYRWEALLHDQYNVGKPHHHRFLSKLKAWLGVSPLWRTGAQSSGVAIDVKLDNGRYVLLNT
ncbi:unnamed protein product [Mycena citricolor]|uniref:Uncharacterized protein n=1 Tax=Mycena citricolor TaxID=2018698 RepID=A0AAD2HT42_9AGAR|nr:unnamed protein product [Mycena citricolor]